MTADTDELVKLLDALAIRMHEVGETDDQDTLTVAKAAVEIAHLQAQVAELENERNSLKRSCHVWSADAAELAGELSQRERIEHAPVVKDWLTVARAAGAHGVRYRTNRALERFLVEISSALASAPERVEAEPTGRLYDADAFMADGEVRMTAAEDVLAHLLINVIGVVDDENYTPNDASRCIEPKLKDLAAIEEMFRSGPGDDEGPNILPEFEAGMSIPGMVEACLHLLERRRDVIAASPLVTDEMQQAAQDVINTMTSTYRARNGRQMSIEADDGEKCWIVHSDQIAALAAALASREAGQ